MKKNGYLALIAIYTSLTVGCQINPSNNLTKKSCLTSPSAEVTHKKTPTTNWTEEHIQTALKSYIYAQMSNNTYGQKGDLYNSDKLDFVLPSDWSFTHFPNDDIGLAYSIYERTKNNKLEEVVIAYRGTEGFKSYKDFIYGNFGTKQRIKAATIYQAQRDKLNASGLSHVPIILTGHSLGGALATHTAINLKEDVPYYVFNTSPRFNKFNWSDVNVEKDICKRNSIVETGELLSFFRYPAREPNQLYTPYNCNEYYKISSSHGIDKLTRCLVEVAKLSDPTIQIKTVPKVNRD
ncbi:lipase family protein [Acinetobacter pittii]|uniref:lipase family protein n=1 Tax=Acinetobacter pittii TaxID=48296 RepID=UPI002AFE522B|nr:hypothetical protein [Acinetobacter pittii]